MTRVFISYARADRPRVAPLAQALAARGYDVWWDVLIEGGAEFARRIEEQLEGCDAVLVVWSAASLGSDWVRDEAGRGRDLRRLVPVTLDGVQPPLGFRQYHAIDLSGWTDRADAPEMQAIASSIEQACKGEREQPASPVLSRGRDRRSVVVAAGLGAIALAGGGAAWWWRSGAQEPENSIAVLPFANLSPDQAQSYFADGLSEELRAALMRNDALQVAASTSSNMFKADTGDARQVAQKLGVAYLLTGSVRRQGDRLRVGAELIDAANGFSRWSHQFDEQLSDVFSVQRQIADTVAQALVAKLGGTATVLGGTRNPAAFDAYLQGLALFNADEGEASDRAALARFDSAIAEDPRYATALAARSRCLAAIGSLYASADTLPALYADSVRTAERAVAIAPELATAQLALGFARLTGYLDIRRAQPLYHRAARLAQGNADVILLTGLFQARVGQDVVARSGLARALQLDPLNPRVFRAAAIVDLCAGRWDEAIANARKTLSLNPKATNAHAIIGAALLATNRNTEALAAYEREPHPAFGRTGVAVARKRLGDAAGAQAAFAKMIADDGDAVAFQQAQVLAQWGENDRAVAKLGKARALRDAGLIGLTTDPLLSPLRNDPRVVQLARELGFPN